MTDHYTARLRDDLARAERERDDAIVAREVTQRENEALRKRLAEMVEQAEQPRGTYRPST